MVFYKSGSLIPCIIAHGLVDAFSKFSLDRGEGNASYEWIYMIATIVVAIIYCLYLIKLPDKEKDAA